MAGLPNLPLSERLRVRRWDAVVLGSALPGLVAAVRLGMRGVRVLVLEEEAARANFPGLREPFVLTSAQAGTVLGECIKDLGVPLIDRPRNAQDPVAYQLALPDARIDVGEPHRTLDELVAWGLAKPDAARSFLAALVESAAAEREALLAAAVVRGAKRPARVPTRSAPEARESQVRRPRPTAELATGLTPPSQRLAALCDAQLRVLSHLASALPADAARARLLGGVIEGTSGFVGRSDTLRGLLRRRIESLYGEFRAVGGRFRVVGISQQPGIALEDSEEAWVGRALILNAPRAALAAAGPVGSSPDALGGPKLTHRRLHVHWQLPRDLLPEGMAARVICVRDPSAAIEGTNVVALRRFDASGGRVDLVASAVVPADGPSADDGCAEIEAAVSGLLPFTEGRLERQRVRETRWDGDDWLADPPPGTGWPRDSEPRLSARPPVYALERADLAALGFEGDLLLGWRAGDAIAGELT